jgi:hypothetical protein
MFWFALHPEAVYYKRYISEAGVRVASALFFFLFFTSTLGVAWLRLRDAGLVPLLFVRLHKGSVVLGGIVHWLTGRTLHVTAGDTIKLMSVAPSEKRTPDPDRGFVYEWRLSSRGSRLTKRTSYPMSGVEARALASQLGTLGLHVVLPAAADDT